MSVGVIIEKDKVSLIENDELKILKLMGYGENSLWFRCSLFNFLRDFADDVSYYELEKYFIEFFNIIKFIEVNPKYSWVDWIHREDFAEKSVIELIRKFHKTRSDLLKKIIKFYGYDEKLPVSKIKDFLSDMDIVISGEDIHIKVNS